MLSVLPPGRPPLLAWYLPAPADRPVIAYFRCNGGKLAHRRDRVSFFLRAQLGLITVEYPGYGGNAGSPSESGMIAAGRAALPFLDAHGVRSSRVAIYGKSIRSAMATQLMTEHTVAGLILESSFTSVLDIARRTAWRRVLLLKLLPCDRFEQLSRLENVILESR